MAHVVSPGFSLSSAFLTPSPVDSSDPFARVNPFRPLLEHIFWNIKLVKQFKVVINKIVHKNHDSKLDEEGMSFAEDICIENCACHAAGQRPDLTKYLIASDR